MADSIETINEQIMENGMDFKHRRIYFGALSVSLDEDGSDVTWRSVERVIRQFHILEDDDPSKPIELHMSSPGGDPYSLLRLYDAIQASPCQIKFFGGGEISSAATWILAGCDERYLLPNTMLCIHDSGMGMSEITTKLTDAYIELDKEKILQGKLNQIFADNSRMPLEFWNEIVKRDLWISAEEAVMLGLADKILEPKKRGNLRRMRIAGLKKEMDRKDMNKMLRMLKDRLYMDRLSKLELHAPEEQFEDEPVVTELPVNTVIET